MFLEFEIICIVLNEQYCGNVEKNILGFNARIKVCSMQAMSLGGYFRKRVLYRG